VGGHRRAGAAQLVPEVFAQGLHDLPAKLGLRQIPCPPDRIEPPAEPLQGPARATGLRIGSAAPHERHCAKQNEVDNRRDDERPEPDRIAEGR